MAYRLAGRLWAGSIDFYRPLGLSTNYPKLRLIADLHLSSENEHFSDRPSSKSLKIPEILPWRPVSSPDLVLSGVKNVIFDSVEPIGASPVFQTTSRPHTIMLESPKGPETVPVRSKVGF